MAFVHLKLFFHSLLVCHRSTLFLARFSVRADGDARHQPKLEHVGARLIVLPTEHARGFAVNHKSTPAKFTQLVRLHTCAHRYEYIC